MRVPAIAFGTILTGAVVCAVASATPGGLAGAPSPQPKSQPQAGADSSPLVGRVRFFDRTVDLTRSSLEASGAARELRDATARPVQADVDPSLTRRGSKAAGERSPSPDAEARDRFAR